MSRPSPYIRLNGRRLAVSKNERAVPIAPLTVSWGSDTGEGQADAATAQITFLFRDSMGDLPDLKKGAVIEVADPVKPSFLITGKVQTMSAKPSTRIKGALEVTVNIADYMAPFQNEFTAVNWPASGDRRAQLFQLMNQNGWSLNAPTDTRGSSRTVLNSIKISTLLERYISRFRGKIYDTSWRDLDRVLHKQITAFKGSARSLSPDKLRTAAAGWDRTFSAPTIDGLPGPVLTLPASNILGDPSWSSGPEDAVTAVKLSVVMQGDNGQSELSEHNYRTDVVTREALGLRSIDVETDLEDPLQWQPTAALYFNDDAPWRMEALQIRDTDLLTDDQLDMLFERTTRYQTLVVVDGIQPNRPDPGPTTLRSYVAGGEFTWTGKKWEISLNLERAILKIDGDGDWWTCERVAESTNPLIQNAQCNTVGDKLTVADFRFIGAP